MWYVKHFFSFFLKKKKKSYERIVRILANNLNSL